MTEPASHIPAAHPPAEEMNLQQKREEVEGLSDDLKRLLVKYETALDDEGLRGQVALLERWMESYRSGLAAADKISHTGTQWLSDLRDRLKLAAEEMQRLEGEGGHPASKEQAAKVEELLKAVRRIDQVIPHLEHLFSIHHQPDEHLN